MSFLLLFIRTLFFLKLVYMMNRPRDLINNEPESTFVPFKRFKSNDRYYELRNLKDMERNKNNVVEKVRNEENSETSIFFHNNEIENLSFENSNPPKLNNNTFKKTDIMISSFSNDYLEKKEYGIDSVYENNDDISNKGISFIENNDKVMNPEHFDHDYFDSTQKNNFREKEILFSSECSSIKETNPISENNLDFLEDLDPISKEYSTKNLEENSDHLINISTPDFNYEFKNNKDNLDCLYFETEESLTNNAHIKGETGLNIVKLDHSYAFKNDFNNTDFLEYEKEESSTSDMELSSDNVELIFIPTSLKKEIIYNNSDSLNHNFEEDMTNNFDTAIKDDKYKKKRDIDMISRIDTDSIIEKRSYTNYEYPNIKNIVIEKKNLKYLEHDYNLGDESDFDHKINEIWEVNKDDYSIESDNESMTYLHRETDLKNTDGFSKIKKEATTNIKESYIDSINIDSPLKEDCVNKSVVRQTRSFWEKKVNYDVSSTSTYTNDKNFDGIMQNEDEKIKNFFNNNEPLGLNDFNRFNRSNIENSVNYESSDNNSNYTNFTDTDYIKNDVEDSNDLPNQTLKDKIQPKTLDEFILDLKKNLSSDIKVLESHERIFIKRNDNKIINNANNSKAKNPQISEKDLDNYSIKNKTSFEVNNIVSSNSITQNDQILNKKPKKNNNPIEYESDENYKKEYSLFIKNKQLSFPFISLIPYNDLKMINNALFAYFGIKEDVNVTEKFLLKKNFKIEELSSFFDITSIESRMKNSNHVNLEREQLNWVLSPPYEETITINESIIKKNVEIFNKNDQQVNKTKNDIHENKNFLISETKSFIVEKKNKKKLQEYQNVYLEEKKKSVTLSAQEKTNYIPISRAANSFIDVKNRKKPIYNDKLGNTRNVVLFTQYERQKVIKILTKIKENKSLLKLLPEYMFLNNSIDSNGIFLDKNKEIYIQKKTEEIHKIWYNKMKKILKFDFRFEIQAYKNHKNIIAYSQYILRRFILKGIEFIIDERFYQIYIKAFDLSYEYEFRRQKDLISRCNLSIIIRTMFLNNNVQNILEPIETKFVDSFEKIYIASYIEKCVKNSSKGGTLSFYDMKKILDQMFECLIDKRMNYYLLYIFSKDDVYKILSYYLYTKFFAQNYLIIKERFKKIKMDKRIGVSASEKMEYVILQYMKFSEIFKNCINIFSEIYNDDIDYLLLP